jgi:hypothetical protein
MTGTNCDLFTHKSSRSYLNHFVYSDPVRISLLPYAPLPPGIIYPITRTFAQFLLIRGCGRVQILFSYWRSSWVHGLSSRMVCRKGGGG